MDRSESAGAIDVQHGHNDVAIAYWSPDGITNTVGEPREASSYDHLRR